MNIAFWSVEHMHAAQSSVLLAYALRRAYSYDISLQKSVALLQSDFKNHSLDYALQGSSILSDKFFGTGMDQLLSIGKSGYVAFEYAFNASLGLIDNRLLFYRSSNQVNHASFSAEMAYFPALISNFGEIVDDVFVDLAPGMHSYTMDAFLACDVVVICTGQSQYALQLISETLEELKKNSSLKDKDFVVCVGDCDTGSILTRNNIIKRFPSMKKHLVWIPHCSGYKDAFNSGHALDFFQKNIDSSTSYKGLSEYELFFNSLERGESLLLREDDI